MPKPRQLWSLMMPSFESHDAKMMHKKTKISHHERQDIPKPKQLWSMMMPAFGSQDAKIILVQLSSWEARLTSVWLVAEV